MTDLISKQAAIDALGDAHFKNYGSAIMVIQALPSAYPKKGKWIYTRYYTWECSECKQNPTAGMGYVQSKDELFEFCPNCGADMRGEE